MSCAQDLIDEIIEREKKKVPLIDLFKGVKKLMSEEDLKLLAKGEKKYG